MPQDAHENIESEFRGEINIMKNRKATNFLFAQPVFPWLPSNKPPLTNDKQISQLNN
jgi:hypothetical protein